MNWKRIKFVYHISNIIGKLNNTKQEIKNNSICKDKIEDKTKILTKSFSRPISPRTKKKTFSFNEIKNKGKEISLSANKNKNKNNNIDQDYLTTDIIHNNKRKLNLTNNKTGNDNFRVSKPSSPIPEGVTKNKLLEKNFTIERLKKKLAEQKDRNIWKKKNQIATNETIININHNINHNFHFLINHRPHSISPIESMVSKKSNTSETIKTKPINIKNNKQLIHNLIRTNFKDQIKTLNNNTGLTFNKLIDKSKLNKLNLSCNKDIDHKKETDSASLLSEESMFDLIHNKNKLKTNNSLSGKQLSQSLKFSTESNEKKSKIYINIGHGSSKSKNISNNELLEATLSYSLSDDEFILKSIFIVLI